MEQHRRCTRCVMTNQGDSAITFDENGVCSYCTAALGQMDKKYFPNSIGEAKLKELLSLLKEKNKGKKYDCLMGISGGLDSCYLAYLGAVKWKLRIAAIHIDDGFDTEVCKRNLKHLAEKCKIDIHYIKPDAEQFYQLCKAYLKAGVPNIAVPQDNVLFSCIYQYAQEEKITDFLSGANFSLECILQRGNTWSAYDKVNILDINRKFGTSKVDKLPLMSLWDKYYMEHSQKINVFAPLDYIDYTRENALKELSDFCGFEYYGSKHLENYFTGFLQLYWLPQKFNVDKRSSHLSSMIVTNQMTREEALVVLSEPACSEEWLKRAMELLKEKLEISDEEFITIMSSPGHQHDEYRTDKLFYTLQRIKKLLLKSNS